MTWSEDTGNDASDSKDQGFSKGHIAVSPFGRAVVIHGTIFMNLLLDILAFSLISLTTRKKLVSGHTEPMYPYATQWIVFDGKYGSSLQLMFLVLVVVSSCEVPFFKKRRATKLLSLTFLMLLKCCFYLACLSDVKTGAAVVISCALVRQGFLVFAYYFEPSLEKVEPGLNCRVKVQESPDAQIERDLEALRAQQAEERRARDGRLTGTAQKFVTPQGVHCTNVVSSAPDDDDNDDEEEKKPNAQVADFFDFEQAPPPPPPMLPQLSDPTNLPRQKKGQQLCCGLWVPEFALVFVLGVQSLALLLDAGVGQTYSWTDHRTASNEVDKIFVPALTGSALGSVEFAILSSIVLAMVVVNLHVNPVVQGVERKNLGMELQTEIKCRASHQKQPHKCRTATVFNIIVTVSIFLFQLAIFSCAFVQSVSDSYYRDLWVASNRGCCPTINLGASSSSCVTQYANSISWASVSGAISCSAPINTACESKYVSSFVVPCYKQKIEDAQQSSADNLIIHAALSVLLVLTFLGFYENFRLNTWYAWLRTVLCCQRCSNGACFNRDVNNYNFCCKPCGCWPLDLDSRSQEHRGDGGTTNFWHAQLLDATEFPLPETARKEEDDRSTMAKALRHLP